MTWKVLIAYPSSIRYPMTKKPSKYPLLISLFYDTIKILRFLFGGGTSSWSTSNKLSFAVSTISSGDLFERTDSQQMRRQFSESSQRLHLWPRISVTFPFCSGEGTAKPNRRQPCFSHGDHHHPITVYPVTLLTLTWLLYAHLWVNAKTCPTRASTSYLWVLTLPDGNWLTFPGVVTYPFLCLLLWQLIQADWK